ncbi:hypothetical protein HK104_002128 [Borealophlyctis nickersoniae]|nr:hypothetical protein HK104_002128 [Borealophlyctis nickersoniae]
MDVRLNGGSIPPKTQFGGTFTYVEINTAEDSVLAIKGDAIMPEVMGGTLVTPFASVTLLNANVTAQHVVPDIKPEVGKLQGGSEDEAGWVQVVRVRASCPEGTEISVTLPVHFSVKLAPGQIYPVPLNISVAGDKTPSALKIEFDLADLGSTHQWTMTVGDFPLTQRVWGNVYKMTFQDYDHSIHYAMVRPPKRTCTTFPEKKCPVMLTLHGAGVEAASTYWTDAYKQQEYAWLLYPTGRTPWGYDWHGPSYHNVIAALDALHLLPGVPSDLESEMGVNRQRLIYTGHSNGGQGAWWMLSHYPDIAIAGLPAAGYMKIQFYIPFYMRVGDAYADPVLRGILESSIAENDIDLYAANMAGVPILPRTGGADDNVPPFHTRRLARLVNEWNRNPSSTNISEIPHQGHCRLGTGAPAVAGSIHAELAEPCLDRKQGGSKNFTAANTLPVGHNALLLSVPILTHKIEQPRHNPSPSSRRSLDPEHDQHPRRHDLARWSVDGTDFDSPPSESGKSYLRNEDGTWKLSNDLIWISEERHFSTYGPAVFDSPFIIVIPSTHSPRTPTYRQIAQHLVTSWYLYGRGATQIVRDIDVLDGVAAQYNMVVLGGPEDNMFTQKREKGLPVSFLPSGGFQIDTHQYAQPGTGILFLAPSPTRTRMGLFVAGTDIDGLLRAAWTIPFRTGLQVPDYIVVGDEYGDPATGWTARDGAPFGGAGTKGAGGVFAAGYWSNTWDFDARCGYLK